MEALLMSMIIAIALVQSIRVICLKRKVNDAESAIRNSDGKRVNNSMDI